MGKSSDPTPIHIGDTVIINYSGIGHRYAEVINISPIGTYIVAILPGDNPSEELPVDLEWGQFKMITRSYLNRMRRDEEGYN